jgi:hypothetical protein
MGRSRGVCRERRLRLPVEERYRAFRSADHVRAISTSRGGTQMLLARITTEPVANRAKSHDRRTLGADRDLPRRQWSKVAHGNAS